MEIAISITIIGISVVMVTLYILAIILSFFGFIIRDRKPEAKKERLVNQTDIKPVGSVNSFEEDQDEIAAVIAAAIAAFEDDGSQGSSLIRIKSIRSSTDGRLVWRAAGINQNLNAGRY